MALMHLIRNELLIIVILFQINFSVGLTGDIASGISTVSSIFTNLECLIDVGWLMTIRLLGTVRSLS